MQMPGCHWPLGVLKGILVNARMPVMKNHHWQQDADQSRFLRGKANSFGPHTLNPIAGCWWEILTVTTAQTGDGLVFQCDNCGCFI
jgi:hypothetical protein